MLFNKSAGSFEVKAELNLTPLVDVMLVLLIIFIITAPMIHPQQLQVNLPRTSAVAKKNTPSKGYELSLDASGKAFLDGVPLSDAALAEALARIGREEDARVHLWVDQALPYGRVAELMATLQKNGVTRLSFLTTTK